MNHSQIFRRNDPLKITKRTQGSVMFALIFSNFVAPDGVTTHPFFLRDDRSHGFRQFLQIPRILAQVDFPEPCLTVGEHSGAGPARLEADPDVVSESPEDGDVNRVDRPRDRLNRYDLPSRQRPENLRDPVQGFLGGHGKVDGLELGVGVIFREVGPVFEEGVEAGSCHGLSRAGLVLRDFRGESSGPDCS